MPENGAVLGFKCLFTDSLVVLCLGRSCSGIDGLGF